MPWNCLTFQVDEAGIALLTINRPEKLNALNAQTINELEQAFLEAENDPAVKALIITGAGERAFVAGADISGIATGSSKSASDGSARGSQIFRRLEKSAKPSLAAINGFALGGGLELALCCTLRLASDNARLGLPELKLGIIPGYGGTQRLARIVGRGRALEMILTGEPVDAAEAYRIGLVNKVVPQAELLGAAKGLLGKILANGPLAVATAMRAVDSGLDGSLEEGLQLESALFGVVAVTEDCKEGTAAFLEKRKPVFTGK
ncbi:MAG: enoyl-CoA hydratase [Acidobacteria bacterium]|nr:enoyl-CoA hydratase [Acidobacteriota bacterium]